MLTRKEQSSLVDDIIKNAASSDKAFKNKKEFMSAVSSFLKSVLSPAVYLHQYKVNFEDDEKFQIWDLSFEGRIKAKDPYLDNTKYDKGEAYIYLSKKFYSDVNKAAKKYFKTSVDWNNTASIGNIRGFIRKT